MIGEMKMNERCTYIWGASDMGESALNYCKSKFNIKAFIDKKASENFKIFCTLPVIGTDDFIIQNNPQDITVIIAIRYPIEVISFLEEKEFHCKKFIFDGRNKENFFLYEVQEGEICIPEYMDKRYKEWDEYSMHYSKINPFILKLFSTAIKWMKDLKVTGQICEIGCGSGQFANMLFDNNFNNYLGIDFSHEAIKIAKRNVEKHKDRFICEDIFDYFTNKIPQADIFVTFEVLEHINKDIELLNLLPKGKFILFSVPNFRSFNHLRIYNDIEAIKDRYRMINILKYEKMDANSRWDKYYYLVLATII